MSSNKRLSGPPDSGQPDRDRGDRGRGFGTQVFDSKSMKYGSAVSRSGEGPPGAPGTTGRDDGRRGLSGASGRQAAGDAADGATIGGLPVTQTTGGRRRQGGRRNSLDNGRSVDAGRGSQGGGRRGSIDSEQGKPKQEDGQGSAVVEMPEGKERDQAIQKQRGRVMLLSSKGDWPALDHALKMLEKLAPEPVIGEPKVPYLPLKDLAEEVSSTAESHFMYHR
ncbi:collagen alpha chain-like [Homarus americanus]|uniref:collagen alpha chain-like n=1 Tax=Homarus americanus TaxID=6706 RepID=UPI001C47F7BD|nr:collagen alpha chain-like [Homarus americanus]